MKTESEIEDEAVEGNELIAAFMGLRRQEPGEYNLPSWWNPDKDKRKKGKFVGYPHQLKYHKSWDWLMEVVTFMEDLVVEEGIITRSAVDVKIYYKACKLKFEPDEDYEDYDEFETQTQGETKLEAVYKAVVEFIKWYNSVTGKELVASI